MPWDYVLWTNRQQVMSRLPRAYPGVRVLYVSPPRFAFSKSAAARPGDPDGRWTLRRDDRLWELQPLLPAPNRLAQRYGAAAFDRYTRWTIRQTARRLGFDRPVLWTYTPFAGPLLGQLDERLVCYDVVDDYPALPHYQRLRPGVTEADRRLTTRADLVFYASDRLYEHRRDQNPFSYHLGNAADIDLFATAQTEPLPLPDDLAGIPDPIVTFHGAVTAYKLDLPLIRTVATAHPEWSFVFLGPVLDETSQQALADLPNLHLLGAKPLQQLPAYLARTAVSIIPYQRNPYTEGINALKLYECLAAGKPVVATALPCFAEFSRLIYQANDAETFASGIARALSDPNDGLERLETARGYSWDRKVDRLMELITSRLDGTLADPGAMGDVRKEWNA
jgi:glycosyltransferase involved in cell wall biosynthesis